MPEESFVVEQGDLGGRGLVEVMSTREFPIGSTTSCCSKKINQLVINVMIESDGTKGMTKWKDV